MLSLTWLYSLDILCIMNVIIHLQRLIYMTCKYDYWSPTTILAIIDWSASYWYKSWSLCRMYGI